MGEDNSTTGGKTTDSSTTECHNVTDNTEKGDSIVSGNIGNIGNIGSIGNIGNIGTYDTSATKLQDGTSATIPQECTVANITGETIRVYYDKTKMQTLNIVEPGKTSYNYIIIKKNDTFSFSTKGIYATVCLESPSGACEKVIVENYEILNGKCFMVKADSIQCI